MAVNEPGKRNRDPENVRLWNKRYYQENKEHLKEYAKAYHRRRRDESKSGRPPWTFRKYGITEDIFLETIAAQGGVCAICRGKMIPPYIDHDHASGRFRGVLCGACNKGLGYFRDHPDLLAGAIRYLKETK